MRACGPSYKEPRSLQVKVKVKVTVKVKVEVEVEIVRFWRVECIRPGGRTVLHPTVVSCTRYSTVQYSTVLHDSLSVQNRSASATDKLTGGEKEGGVVWYSTYSTVHTAQSSPVRVLYCTIFLPSSARAEDSHHQCFDPTRSSLLTSATRTARLHCTVWYRIAPHGTRVL